MAKVTVPNTVVRHRMPNRSVVSSAPGNWSKWHMVITVSEPWKLGDKQLVTHRTRCDHFYELGDARHDGAVLTEVSDLSHVKAADLCGKCFKGLLVED